MSAEMSVVNQRQANELAKWQKMAQSKMTPVLLFVVVALLCLIRGLDEFATSATGSLQTRQFLEGRLHSNFQLKQLRCNRMNGFGQETLHPTTRSFDNFTLGRLQIYDPGPDGPFRIALANQFRSWLELLNGTKIRTDPFTDNANA